MSETVISILIYLHVTGIAIWIGSQVLVGSAVMPSLRRVQDGAIRLEALTVFTRRFGFVAWSAMIVIVLSGGIMTGERIDDVKAIFGDSIFDARWGWIFVIKMTLWAVMVGLVGLHSFILGPRQMDLNRQALASSDAGEMAAVRALQRRSILISVAGLILSLLVLGCGAFLANHGFSYVGS